jgi:hypothetical protein
MSISHLTYVQSDITSVLNDIACKRRAWLCNKIVAMG